MSSGGDGSPTQARPTIQQISPTQSRAATSQVSPSGGFPVYPSNPSYTGNPGTGPPAPLSSPQPFTHPSPPATLPPPSQQSYFVRRGAFLRQRAVDALNHHQDTDLQNMLREHYFSIPTTQRLPQNEIVDLVARFLDLSSMRIEPDLAAVYLARYGWLYERAVEVWLHERFEDENEDGVEEWKSGVGYVSLGEWRRGMREVEEEEDSDEESESESDSEDEDIQETSDDQAHLQKRLRRAKCHLHHAGIAVKGHPDPTKLSITINSASGGPPTTTRWPHAATMDWDNGEHVRCLNRWRAQRIRRTLGTGSRPTRIPFDPLENTFLIAAHRNHILDAQAHNRAVDWTTMDWDRITTDFNNHFENRRLQGGTGVVRPVRTAGALRAARSRIPAIVAMTGITPRTDTKTSRGEKDGDGTKGAGDGGDNKKK